MKKAAFLDRDGVIYRKASEGLAANKLSAELNTKPDGGWLPQAPLRSIPSTGEPIPRPKSPSLPPGFRAAVGDAGGVAADLRTIFDPLDRAEAERRLQLVERLSQEASSYPLYLCGTA